jgi:aspartyl-tRNA(Asn)/glutamyl-tRNA(Gln) amidotransferase subunit A
MMGTLTIAEAAAQIARGDLSPEDLLQQCMQKIRQYDAQVHAFHHVREDEARAAAAVAAREIKRGGYRGPLHGIPIAYKDVVYLAGERVTANSRRLAEFFPTHDSTVIRRLKESGAVLVGSLNTFEFAFGGPAFDLPYPPARNPWNPDRWTGAGSSAGSAAAIASGFCLGALGTDAGGSIRSPASMSGISGIRPTFGRVSTYGSIPLTFSTEAAGPMAWTAKDCALMLQVLAGHDVLDPFSADEPVDDYTSLLGHGIEGLRVGLLTQFYEEDYATDPEIIEAINRVADTLKGLGAKVGNVPSGSSLWDYHAIGRIIIPAEAYAHHEEYLQQHPEKYGELLRNRLMLGALIRASDYLQAQRLRRRLTVEMQALFNDWDVLLSPGMLRPAAPLSIKQIWPSLDLPMIDMPYSLTGNPSIAVCGGFFHDGMPIGVQLAGRYFDEATVLRVADAYEQAAPWRKHRPDLGRVFGKIGAEASRPTS